MDEKEFKPKLYNEVAGECLYDKCSLIGKSVHFRLNSVFIYIFSSYFFILLFSSLILIIR